MLLRTVTVDGKEGPWVRIWFATKLSSDSGTLSPSEVADLAAHMKEVSACDAGAIHCLYLATTARTPVLSTRVEGSFAEYQPAGCFRQ